MKNLFKKYWHALFALYGFIYLPSFTYLEKTVTTDYNLIHCALDDKIPFCEFFILPYLFWFIFIAAACIYFFFRSQEESVRLYSYLVIGMSIAVLIFFVYPNGLGDFRPHNVERDNFCMKLVNFLYSKDTSTNVFPSLHVYNTLVVLVAVYESKTFGKYHTVVKIVTSIIGLLICLATMFLKQHSVYDVLGGIALAAILYPLIYKTKWFRLNRSKK